MVLREPLKVRIKTIMMNKNINHSISWNLNVISFFFLLFLFVFPISFPLRAKDLALKREIETRINSIPLEEREILEHFFRRLFYHGDFAYTLLDRKPMGSIDYNLELLACPQFYKAPENHLFLMALDKKGWNIWEKYKDLFPMKKYSLIKVEHDTFFGILLINKEKVATIIKKNLSLFQELVGKKLHARKILKLLCSGTWYYHSNSPCLLIYYKAIGLLYGYGKDNVRWFVKRAQLSQNLRSLPIEMKAFSSNVIHCIEMEDSSVCSKCQLQNDFEIKTLSSELNVLLKKVQLINGTNKNNPFLPLRKSLFLGNEQLAQTKSIIEGYEKLNKIILKIYESDKLLETVLEILTSG